MPAQGLDLAAPSRLELGVRQALERAAGRLGIGRPQRCAGVGERGLHPARRAGFDAGRDTAPRRRGACRISRLLQGAGAYEDARRAYDQALRVRLTLDENGADSGNLLGAVNALRKDVRGLRAQVQELTQLVRRLGDSGKGVRLDGWRFGKGGQAGKAGLPGKPGGGGGYVK